MANQFKVGDRVEYNDPKYKPSYDHGFGKVVDVSESGNLYQVVPDYDPYSHGWLNYWEDDLRHES